MKKMLKIGVGTLLAAGLALGVYHFRDHPRISEVSKTLQGLVEPNPPFIQQTRDLSDVSPLTESPELASKFLRNPDFDAEASPPYKYPLGPFNVRLVSGNLIETNTPGIIDIGGSFVGSTFFRIPAGFVLEKINLTSGIYSIEEGEVSGLKRFFDSINPEGRQFPEDILRYPRVQVRGIYNERTPNNLELTELLTSNGDHYAFKKREFSPEERLKYRKKSPDRTPDQK